MPSSNTHWQVAQTQPQPKPAKEYCCPKLRRKNYVG